jgi:RimJ/RimL family protein N-acetyltransferase
LLFPHVETRRLKLVPSTASEETFDILLSGGVESLSDIDTYLADHRKSDINAYFLSVSKATGKTIGFTTLHELNQPAGHVQVGLYSDIRQENLGLGGEAAILTINYAFAMWNVRKVYVRTTKATISNFGPQVEKSEPEAVLRDHFYFCGRLWDVYIYSISREDWSEWGMPEMIERFLVTGRAGRNIPKKVRETLS